MRHPVYGHFHEIEIDAIREIEWCFRRSRREYLSRTTPNQRFKEFLRANCKMVSCNYQFLEDVWSWDDCVVFEIENAKWDDIDGSDTWLWYWRKAYVVDSKRASGAFKRFCSELQKWCDKSGVVVCFIASAFGYDVGNFGIGSDLSCGRPASFLANIEEVSCAWRNDIVEIRPDDWLVEFYRSVGFRNSAMIFSGLSKSPDKIPLERQFVYVGKEADWKVSDGVRRRDMRATGTV